MTDEYSLRTRIGRLVAERIKLVRALETVEQAGNDIADMADDFIIARDSKGLRNYGANIASIAHTAISKAKPQ